MINTSCGVCFTIGIFSCILAKASDAAQSIFPTKNKYKVTKVYSQASQVSKMELFASIING